MAPISNPTSPIILLVISNIGTNKNVYPNNSDRDDIVNPAFSKIFKDMFSKSFNNSTTLFT